MGRFKNVALEFIVYEGVECIKDGRKVGHPAEDPRAGGIEGKIAAEPDAKQQDERSRRLHHRQVGNQSDQQVAHPHSHPGLSNQCQPKNERVIKWQPQSHDKVQNEGIQRHQKETKSINHNPNGEISRTGSCN